MPDAGCLCGELRVSYTGEAALNALCHCADCRKITGSAFSINYLVPETNFKVTSGTPKEYAKQADSGKTITSYFCGNCGSTVWRQSATYDGHVIFKAGTLDDGAIVAEGKPVMELNGKQRAKWIDPIEGAGQQ